MAHWVVSGLVSSRQLRKRAPPPITPRRPGAVSRQGVHHRKGRIAMQNERPHEAQAVQVRMGAGSWQDATYRNGYFIDRFGLTLNPDRITAWQNIEASVPAHNDEAPAA
jgi:hypothetical protein